MGRVFVEDVEEPAYKCRFCQTSIGVPTDIIFGIDVGNGGRCFVFTKVFNTFLVAPWGCVITRDVFCVYCTAILGRHLPSILEYAAANYHIMRNRLHEPEESSDDEV